MPLGPVPEPTWWECVAQWRLRVGMTKAQLADACGVSRMHLYRIETGQYTATDDQVLAIEAALIAKAVKVVA